MLIATFYSINQVGAYSIHVGGANYCIKKLTTHNIQKYNLSLEYFNLEILNTKSNVIAKTTLLKVKRSTFKWLYKVEKMGRKKKYSLASPCVSHDRTSTYLSSVRRSWDRAMATARCYVLGYAMMLRRET